MCIWFYAILYNEVIKMSIGENIRRIRKDKKLTQKELGEKLEGISQQRWRTIPLPLIGCAHLGVSCRYRIILVEVRLAWCIEGFRLVREHV